jgi:catechol 2,3-dioxygenase-like lactoylglutathione lyase family enzyme
LLNTELPHRRDSRQPEANDTKFGIDQASRGASSIVPEPDPSCSTGKMNMRLGNLSVSLAVKDIQRSRAFYQKLGFRAVGGDAAKNWLILQNETCTIGLFQGMFEKNTLTFNPGWDHTCHTLPEFDDVRDIQKSLLSQGLDLLTQADETSTGPASLLLLDPDGTPILVDQHVPRPQK